MNDATGLVAFKFALAAMLAGTFSLQAAAIDLGVLAVGGTAVGLIVAYAVGRLRDLLRATGNADPFTETTLSVLTPFAAYLPAAALELSGVLAVVAAGLYSGWRDPIRMDVETRRITWSVWMMGLYWLNGFAFVLLGLQLPALTRTVSAQYSPAQMAGFLAVISAATIALRLIGFLPGVYFSFVCTLRGGRNGECPSWRESLVGGWAGMRGAVTLAAALSIPLALPDGTPFPGRDIVIFIAGGIVVVTLLAQGTTIAWLIRRLGLREDDTQREEETLARKAAVDAGLRALRSLDTPANTTEESGALGQVIAEYELRLSELALAGETRASARRRRRAGVRYRLAALEAERRAVDELWAADTITDDVHRPLQQLLDHEEAMLRAQPAPRDD
jgi:CPA1 family monovalent cation:H+ antiporter